MPKEMVLRAWEKHFGGLQPQYVELPREQDLSHFTAPLMKRAYLDWRSTEIDYRLREFAVPFSIEFGVSATAIRIRLEKLGLLHRSVPLQRLVAGN